MKLVRYWVAEIISALEYMIQQGFIHRDLKPDNILISEDWHLKLVIHICGT